MSLRSQGCSGAVHELKSEITAEDCNVSKPLVELAIVIVCIALLGSYHLTLLRKLRTSPDATGHGRWRTL